MQKYTIKTQRKFEKTKFLIVGFLLTYTYNFKTARNLPEKRKDIQLDKKFNPSYTDFEKHASSHHDHHHIPV